MLLDDGLRLRAVHAPCLPTAVTNNCNCLSVNDIKEILSAGLGAEASEKRSHISCACITRHPEHRLVRRDLKQSSRRWISVT